MSLPTNATGARGGVVVKALRYKPAGRWFDSVYVEQSSGADVLCELVVIVVIGEVYRSVVVPSVVHCLRVT